MRRQLCILFMFAFAAVFAQSKTQYAQNAQQEFIKGNYVGAAYAYQNLYNLDTTNIDIAYKLADAYLNYFAYKKAYHYFSIVNASSQRLAFIESLYQMALINKYLGNYDLSEKQFNQYVKEASNKSSFQYLSAVQELKSAPQLKAILKDSVHCTVTPLAELNTVNAEFSPKIIADTSLYFSAMRVAENNQYRIGVFNSNGSDFSWQQAKALAAINAANANVANISFNHDFTKFVFSSCNDNNSCELKMCSKKDTGWTSPVALGAQINLSGFINTHPNWTKLANKEYLFFASNRNGGRGKLDIWYSELVNGEFTSAKNVGSAINTPSDDITPFYSIADTALYFSSDWHVGVGGMDIFSAKGIPTQFKNPVNIGVPINSSRNDQYFIINEKGAAYFASHREGTLSDKDDAICCSDLYYTKLNKKKEVPMPLDTLPYKLIEAYVELPLVLYFHNDEPNPRNRDTVTKYTYMETYDAYKKLVPDYVSKYPQGLQGEDKEMAAEDIQRFFDDYVDLGVENLHKFTTDLLKYLEQGYSAEVLIKGFASPLTTSSYNVNLSLRRISSLINYLKQYNGGVYVPYFNGTAANGAKLTFIKNPNGEYKSAAGVSDDYYDVRNSIYNPHAAIERRIEVVRVNLITKEPKEIPYFDNFRKMEIDLDTISGDKVSHKIYLRNTSDEAWTVEDLGADCSCTQLRWNKSVVEPGDILTVEFTINLAGKHGEKHNIISFKKSNNKEFQVIELKYFVE